ncbi:MAG: prolipoprotein diacylglyceryl transferase [Firmicutes bacterium]|nr:prolipoprotein diacylglyceryl transferase [Bacillota bacterium]
MVAFTIAGIEIYWYAILAVTGFGICTIFAWLLLKEKKQLTEMPFDMILIALPAAIIGARVWYMIFNPGMTSGFLDIRGGGLAWHGGLFAVILSFWGYALYKKIHPFKVFDVGAAVVPFGHAMGRVGNILNVEIYGRETNNLQASILTQEIDGVHFHNIAFYELILNLGLFAGLVFWYRKNNKVGLVGPLYLIGYGIVRLVLEPLRHTRYIMTIGGAPISVITSVLMIIAGAAMLGWFIYLYYFKKVGLFSWNTYNIFDEKTERRLNSAKALSGGDKSESGVANTSNNDSDNDNNNESNNESDNDSDAGEIVDIFNKESTDTTKDEDSK